MGRRGPPPSTREADLERQMNQTEQTFGIMAVDHVNLATPRARQAETLTFYRQVLGLTEIPKPAEQRGRGGAWFLAGDLQLHISVDPDPDDPLPKSKRHVCFLVADLAAAKSAALAFGLTIEEESVTEGLARFFIRDPADNRVEIGQRI
jgi:catechol 2,3-dioxygenase-like lactoylglutathione lyase family enzyme